MKAIWHVRQKAYLQESLLLDYPNLPPLKETLADIGASSETFIAYYLDSTNLESTMAGVLSILSKTIVSPLTDSPYIQISLVEVLGEHC
ncbi:MAG: hypothetical protein ACRCYY_03905 [Trueperaceae bacterium]